MSDFQINIGRRRLAKHKQKDKSESLKAMAEVREIGVVYNVNKTSIQLLNKVVHHFEAEGKDVITLGFLEEKELGDLMPTYKEEYYCKKDINLWKLPKKESMSRFLSKDFDFLINLDMEGRNELQGVSTYSASKTRIGKHFKAYPFAQDFMIKSLADTAEELFNDLKKYIK